MLLVGVAVDGLLRRAGADSRAVALLTFGSVAVVLDQHRVIDLRTKSILDGGQVYLVAVAGELDAVRASVRHAFERLLQARLIAPGRHTQQNLVDDFLRQRVLASKRVEAWQRRFLAVLRANTWSLDLDTTTAEAQLSRRAAPSVVRPILPMLARSVAVRWRGGEVPCVCSWTSKNER